MDLEQHDIILDSPNLPILKCDGRCSSINYEKSDNFWEIFDNHNIFPDTKDFQTYYQFVNATHKWEKMISNIFRKIILPTNCSGFYARPLKSKRYRLNRNNILGPYKINSLLSFFIENQYDSHWYTKLQNKSRDKFPIERFVKENKPTPYQSYMPNPELFDDYNSFKNAMLLWFKENKMEEFFYTTSEFEEKIHILPLKPKEINYKSMFDAHFQPKYENFVRELHRILN